MTERFTLLTELGRGGMGVVWKARDEETGQVVALKLLREAYAEDPEYLARFERELELARRIDSAHVVKVLGFGIWKKVPYLALEYVDGPSLHDALAKHGPYSWPETRALLIQLAQGLADANAAGVIHRDVKPSNVLIGPDGVAKLTDFGIARGIDTTRMTATSTMLGTPAYLAPEGPKDARSDLYSLGIIGYQLLTGAVPFKGTSHQEVIFEHVRTPPDLSRLPTESRRIIGMLLAKDPSERPQRASLLLTILGADALAPAAQTPVVQTSPLQPVVVAAPPSQSVIAAAPPPQPVPARWTPLPPPAYSPGRLVYPPAWGGQNWAPSRPPDARRRSSAPLIVGLGVAGLVVCLLTAALAGGLLSGKSTPAPASGTFSPTGSVSPAGNVTPTPTSIVVAAPTPAQSPLIISVSGISPMATQTIRIEGSGFGQHAPYTGCTSFIELADLTGAWNAGWKEPGSPGSDSVTLRVVSWTDSEIVLGGLAGDYGAVYDAGGYHYDFNLKSGDQVRIRIWNAQTSSGPAVFLRTVS